MPELAPDKEKNNMVFVNSLIWSRWCILFSILENFDSVASLQGLSECFLFSSIKHKLMHILQDIVPRDKELI